MYGYDGQIDVCTETEGLKEMFIEKKRWIEDRERQMDKWRLDRSLRDKWMDDRGTQKRLDGCRE